MSSQLSAIAWMTICAALVMLMQGGFCLLESGFCRPKNSINVAIKNLVDFCIAGIMFYLCGFGLMFGDSMSGFIGGSHFAMKDSSDGWLWAFFLFQLVFCGTATTIISGAVAERIRFTSYLQISFLVSAFFYPVFGHWAWGGGLPGTSPGWLKALGYIDFAGCSVVHAVGGWIALAAAIILGPRLGRFSHKARPMHGYDLVLATLGAMLLWFGWFGFNGGSTLDVTSDVPKIVVNTNLSACAGAMAALALAMHRDRRADVAKVINGCLAGLVGITAACHLVSPLFSIVIGGVAGWLSVYAAEWLEDWKIDDAVGAVPVHAVGGTWGILAVALFAPEGTWTPGLTRWEQFSVQILGAGTCFAFAFGGGYAALRLLNRVSPLRVDRRSEQIGLNVAEHGESSEVLDLLTDMRRHRRKGVFSRRVRAESNSEVGQMAAEYNRVLDRVNDEINAREDAATAVQEAEAKYRGIFENAFEGIFQTTAEGRYLSANPALARIYGYGSPEEMQSGIADIERQLYVDPKRREQFAQELAASDVVSGFESEVYRKDGSIIWISENARAIRDAQGALLRYEGTVEDITERRQTEAMRLQIEEAEAANRAKSDFLAKMSHEIRTPLNGVIGILDLLAGTPVDARQERYIRIAKSSADSLLSLINDILDFSKIEAGKLELETAEFDLPVLLEDVAEMFVHRAQVKGLELTCRVFPETPRRVLGDSERLRQILVNLTYNAIKFTAKGEVEIRAQADTCPDGRPAVRLAVRDTGIGIPEAARNRLFNAFMQVDASTTRRFGGTGLGLAICKQLVELMEGEIGVDSEPNVGSTFWCRIPMEASTRCDDVRNVPEELKRMRVLAVDDTETNLEILREQFQRWGVSLETTSCAGDALAALQGAAAEKRPFDLAILDQLLPDFSGRDLAEKIRREEGLRGMPLMMLTSLDGVINSDDAQRLGFVGCLTKPIRQSRLFDAIVQVAAKLNDATPYGIQPKAVEPAGPMTMKRILVTDDNEINQLVAADILKNAGYNCETVGSGADALTRLAREKFDVVLMDCEMPEMDGLMTTKKIREWESREQRPRLPIIALTANAIEGDRDRCLAAGMDDYVTKPVNRLLLLAAIARFFPGKNTASQNPVAPIVATPPSPVPAPVATSTYAIHWNELMERSVGDETFARKILRRFSERLPDDVAKLQAAIQGDDVAKTVQLSHSIKGAASNVSAHGVGEAAAVIEKLARAGDLSDGRVRLSTLEREMTRCLDTVESLLNASA